MRQGRIGWLVAMAVAIGTQAGCIGKSRRAVAGSPPNTPPLASWRDGPAKTQRLDFVRRVTDQNGNDFVPPRERVAAFDNDGTLWVEKPLPFQLMFAVDRARAMVADDPSLAGKTPFKSLLDRGEGLDEAEIAGMVAETHSGMTPETMRMLVEDWIATSRHPRFGRPPTACVYQPQLELLAFLRAKGFKIFIVSGGGVDFMRAFSEAAYGVPPEDVVGSSGKTEFHEHGGKGDLLKLPQVESADNNAGKPININLHVGRRPILAFGNSDGDLEMLQYTQGGSGPRLMLLVHHDDPRREYAYDRDTRMGRLNRALNAAAKQGWVVVSMAHDWKTIFPELPDGAAAAH